MGPIGSINFKSQKIGERDGCPARIRRRARLFPSQTREAFGIAGLSSLHKANVLR